MPHRQQELIQLCVECKERATEACMRCGAPMCDGHRVGDEERCARCEAHFELTTAKLKAVADSGQKRGLAIGSLIAFGIMGLGVANASGLSAYVAIAIGSAFYGLGMFFTADSAKLRRKWKRRRFLEERKPGLLTGEGPKLLQAAKSSGERPG